ncbi:hypothetical protein Tco_0232355 [Tanacetum coccineum]
MTSDHEVDLCSVSHADADVDSFKRCGTSNTFDVGYWVRKDLILHRSSINNNASLSNRFRGFYFTFKFGISGLLHYVVTTIADRIRDNGTSQFKQNFQSSSMTFITFQDFCLLQELLEHMDVHDNDASENLQPSWGEIVSNLEYKFQDQKNIKDIFSFGRALEDVIFDVIVLVRNIDKANNESKIVNESLTAELERYKERVKNFKQRFKVDLSSLENFIDSQMDDVIPMKNTKFAAIETEIDTLKQTLSKHVKEKESLLTTLNGFKIEFKERESKSINKEIVLENKNTELEDIVCKLYQSTQAMHMLTKPQVFYDNTHKQALGYQNPFYLKRAQGIKPILYDGNVLSKTYDVLSVVVFLGKGLPR